MSYSWRDLRTDLQLPHLIARLNDHFRQVTQLFHGLIQVDAGYRISRFAELPVLSADPPAPSAGVRLFVTVNGSSKHELRARFPTGATQIIATEP